MARNLFFVVATIWAFVPCITLGSRVDTDRPSVNVSISVFNDAHVEPFVLAVAQQKAESVFHRAGITLNWIDCGSPGNWRPEAGCQDVSFPAHLSVRLVTRKRGLSAETFGQSYLDGRGQGSYANVYAASLASAKALALINEGDLLGYVVAHEVGHLLLGKSSHSPDGLMRAKWEVGQLLDAAHGKLGFTSGEAELMRARYLSAESEHLGVVAMAISARK